MTHFASNIPDHEPITIAVDAMGGDNAPEEILAGVHRCKNIANVSFLIYGNQRFVKPHLEQLEDMKERYEFIHVEEFIKPTDKPREALKNGKNSSMAEAIKAVKEGKADTIISAGNTGALVALSTIILRTLEGISRAALTSVMPTVKEPIIMLDLGANVNCEAGHLHHFGIMGNVFAEIILERENLKTGLLNIGSEDTKGNPAVKDAARLLSEDRNINYNGFVEADAIGKGGTDVIVTDGFSGNIALKAVEGTAVVYTKMLKRAFSSSILAKIGYLFMKPALKHLKSETDPRKYNGAMLLGLNGIVIKSHGSADRIAYENALRVAIKLASRKINDSISKLIIN